MQSQTSSTHGKTRMKRTRSVNDIGPILDNELGVSSQGRQGLPKKARTKQTNNGKQQSDGVTDLTVDGATGGN
jgi:hypothetical protein